LAELLQVTTSKRQFKAKVAKLCLQLGHDPLGWSSSIEIKLLKKNSREKNLDQLKVF